MAVSVQRGKPVAKKLGRPPKEGGRLKGRIVLMCTDEYLAWMAEVAEKLRTNTSGAVDRIIAEWAEQRGMTPPPPRT
jgi:hypothetical protein